MSKKLTVPKDKAAPDVPNLDEAKSIPVGLLKFNGTQDGRGFAQRSSLSSCDQRDQNGNLVSNRQYSMVFIPSLNAFRCKWHNRSTKKDEPFMVASERVAYWQVLNE